MQLRTTLRFALPIITALIVLLAGSPFLNAQDNDTENTYYFLTDHLGSVDVVMDDQGTIIERADYLPYGSDRLRITQPDAPDTDYKFTGKEMDEETGLMYYGARYYDSSLGRFISFDPLLLNEGGKPLESVLPNPQSLNPYSYVINNPVRYTDETGEYQEDVHYDLTYFLSMAAGLDAGQSKTIATFDQYVDENPATTPGNKDGAEGVQQAIENANNGTTEKYHFASRAEALSRVCNSIASGSLEQFGESLHTFQDTYSHANLTPATHFILGEGPDLTKNNPEKALTMAHASFNLMRGFSFLKNGTGDLNVDQYQEQTEKIWAAISPYVSQFAIAEDKTNTTIGMSASLSKQNAQLSSDNKKKEKK